MSGPRPLLAARSSSGEKDGNGNASPGSNRPPGAASGRPKRTLIESACSACRRRKSRVRYIILYFSSCRRRDHDETDFARNSAMVLGRNYKTPPFPVIHNNLLTTGQQTNMLALPESAYRLPLRGRRGREPMVGPPSPESDPRG